MKLTFAKGASLEDPSGLFNASLEGNTRRAIDIHEGDKIDEKAFKALIRAAVALNTSARAAARPVRLGRDQACLRERLGPLINRQEIKDRAGCARTRVSPPPCGEGRLGRRPSGVGGVGVERGGGAMHGTGACAQRPSVRVRPGAPHPYPSPQGGGERASASAGLARADQASSFHVLPRQHLGELAEELIGGASSRCR